MSLTTFKKKSVINYGSKRSGKPPGGIWLPQGPFGASTQSLKDALNTYGPVGFSLNGGHRNIGGVGRSMHMSQSGTPYRGIHPIGFGGSYGSYKRAQPLLNSQIVDTLGSQYLYIKPSVLSTKGMLMKKYKWAYYGKYPNYWVQPNYTGNLTDNTSQGLYIQSLASANTCNLKVNNSENYETNYVRCGPTLCKPGRSTAKFKYNDMARNGPYSKDLYQPVDYSEYNSYLTKKCTNPSGPQKPFPFGVTRGSSHNAAGTSIRSFGSGCNSTQIYLEPPAWYTKSGPEISAE